MVSSIHTTLFFWALSHTYLLYYHYIPMILIFVLYFIGSKSTPIDNSILNFQSTCHEALETCNKHPQCQEMVASIIRNCNHRQCKKDNCMESLQNFYRNESMHSYAIEIAFCLCKWVTLFVKKKLIPLFVAPSIFSKQTLHYVKPDSFL